MTVTARASTIADTPESLVAELSALGNPDEVISKLARDVWMVRRIEAAIEPLPTNRELVLGDGREDETA